MSPSSNSRYDVAIPDKLIPVFQGEADVRGSYGGRGSAKTRSFAKMAAVVGMRFGMAGVKGQVLCARQFMNSLDDSSLEEVKRAVEDEPVLASYYEIGEKYVRSRDGRIDFSFAGLDRNIDSIKSKGRILLCWVDEAEPVTESAWAILIPTLREEGEGWNAELWVTWNPKREKAPVERFRNSKDPRVKVVEMHHSDNPKFPAVLERARLRDLEERPEDYAHVWDGAYKTHFEGAYYTKQLLQARQQGRVTRLPEDPYMSVNLFTDIGGTGAKSDNFVFIAAQFVAREIPVINHYEVQGQSLGYHLDWLRTHFYTPQRSVIWLPHDGQTNDRVFAVSYESAFKQAGYQVRVVPNQGRGAAKMRIEAAKRHFNAIYFNEATTGGLLSALAQYHEKRDDDRGIGLGPEHDAASHSADAFGMMCVVYDNHLAQQRKPPKAPTVTPFRQSVPGMGY